MNAVFKIFSLILIVSLPVWSLPNQSRRTIIPNSNSMQAVLGSAYDSNKEAFLGDQCVDSGDARGVISTGQSQALFSFDQSMSEKQLANELGMGLSGHASFGVLDSSMSADYFSKSVSNSFSVSASWKSEYLFPVDKLTKPVLTPKAKDLSNNDTRWSTTCGDEYVAEIARGGKLFFTVRVDFSSEEIKNSFNASFSISGPTAGVTGTLRNASATFGHNAVVTVTATQIGGDVSKLTGLFGTKDTTGTAAFIQCQLGQFEECAKVVENFLSYATDLKNGFPSQLAPGSLPGPSVLEYRTAAYSALGIYPHGFPILTQATQLARNKLSGLFLSQYQLMTAGRRLLAQHHSDGRLPLIRSEQTKVESNISQILPVAEVCYNQPDLCWANVEKIQLLEINKNLFAPASFVELCNESLMMQEPEVRETFFAISSAIGLGNQGPRSIQECKELGEKAHSISSLRVKGSDFRQGITDLSPFATLINLTSLELDSASIRDVAQLSGLINLKSLSLAHNRIQDISPLADMTALEILNLGENDIIDASALKSMHRMRKLFLYSNLITDVSALQNFPNLLILDLRANPVDRDRTKIDSLNSALPSSTIKLF